MTSKAVRSAGSALLMLSKIKEPQGINVASAHNKRESFHSSAYEIGQATSCLYGPQTAFNVAQLARDLMAEAGIKPRKNSVRAIEAIVTINLNSEIDESQFFQKSLDWLANRFGGQKNVLSADRHYDEAKPHMHVLILPVEDGRLNGSDMLGGRGKFRGHIEDFSRDVLPEFNLKPPIGLFCSWQRDQAAQQIEHYLRAVAHSVVASDLWEVVLQCIRKQPAPFMQALHLTPE